MIGVSVPKRLIFLSVLSLVAVGSLAQKLVDPIPRKCNDLGSAGGTRLQEANRNEYPAGGTLMALAQVPAGVKGVFEFYLCPAEDNTNDEECLSRLPLQLGDGSGSKFDLSKVTKEGIFEIPLSIPDEVSCDQCTLQLRVRVEDCGTSEGACQLMDKEFCSDISVRTVKNKDKKRFRFRKKKSGRRRNKRRSGKRRSKGKSFLSKVGGAISYGTNFLPLLLPESEESAYE